jgi:hypothetical protein
MIMIQIIIINNENNINNIFILRKNTGLECVINDYFNFIIWFCVYFDCSISLFVYD